MSSLQELQMSAEALQTALTSLPDPLPGRIWLALPVDARARCSCVCRAWRDALADPSLWTCLDLTPAGGVEGERAQTDAALLGAARRARGRLETLRVVQIRTYPPVVEVLRENALHLRELCVSVEVRVDDLDTLAAAAPQLRTLDATVGCAVEDAPRLLRAEPPLACLRLRGLEVEFDEDDDLETAPLRTRHSNLFLELLADPSLQPSLSRLQFCYAQSWHDSTPDAVAVVDAALARRLRTLEFYECTPPPAAQLARLLAGGALTKLCFEGHQPDGPAPLYTGDDATAVAAALRASSLDSLKFDGSDVCLDLGAALVLLGALVGHKTLRSLTLSGDTYLNDADAGAALGAALGAIVAADTPAFTKLDISGPFRIRYDRRLDEDILAPVLAALPRNSHLQTLEARLTIVSHAFARNQLLPAVRANSSLQQLYLYPRSPWPPAAARACLLVHRRARRISHR